MSDDVAHENWRPRLGSRAATGAPSSSAPLYLQVVESIRAAIRLGELRPGDRLPTHRALARQLDVTISTVTHAYAEAARLHLVHGQVGRGTFVLGESVDAGLFAATLVPRSSASPEHRPPPDSAEATGWIDLSSNVPATPSPDLDVIEGLQAVIDDGVIDGGYPTPATLSRGRSVIAELLERRGVVVRDVDVVLTAGAQQALLAGLIAAAGAGAKVMVEELTFPGMKAVARQLNLQLIPVRMDDRGVVPADLARTARRSGAGVLVCVPCLQNPTTATMDAARRDEVAAVARRNDLLVIEDDVYGALHDEPALASVLPDRTVVVTSTSKTIAPGLRLGALAGSHPVVAAAARDVSLTAWTVSPTMIELAARWSRDGVLGRRIAWQRREIDQRSHLLAPMWRPAPSPHQWLPTQTAPARAVELAASAGVGVVGSDALAASVRAPKGLRVSLAASPTRADVRAGLLRLHASGIRWA